MLLLNCRGMGMLRLCVLLAAAAGTCLAFRTLRVKPQVSYHQSCFLDEIESLNPTKCSGLEDGGYTVADGGNCSVGHGLIGGGQKAMDHRRLELDVLKCQHGRWTGTDSSVWEIKHRQKRWFWWFVAGVITCYYLCNRGGGGGGTTVITKYPPSFSDPCKPSEVQGNYNVAAGESSAVVAWTSPTATDKNGDTPSVTQVGGGTNGGSFEGSVSGETHYITYNAADSDGLTGHCYFSFTVTILTCDTLAWPDNGARTCENNNILGSSCRYYCDSGYQISGNDAVICGNDASPTWSKVPTCEKVTCIAPTTLADGSLDCTDVTYAYGTICTNECADGYALEGQLYMQCLASGTWSNTESSACKDDTPPAISCTTPQVFYADRSMNSTSVSWDLPTAIDNTDSDPEIVKTDGPTMGAVLEVGSEHVKYKATDSDGNQSPECLIELRVEEIACGHPLDTFDDIYLRSHCSTSRYVYGTECALTCTSNLPLEGTDLIVCEKKGQFEGVWDWGNGTKPFCREVACPDLDPPINGALVYDTILTRPVRTVMCNNQFDIANMGSNFNGMLFCTDNGAWSPFDSVPDCIYPRNPRFLYLPAEIFYYSGDCGTEATMEEIEQNFKDIIENNLNPYFESICPTGETCTVDNIAIECGPIQPARKRRSLSWENTRGDFIRHDTEGNGRDHHIHKRQAKSHLLILDFNIIVVLNLDNTTLTPALVWYDNIQLEILKPAVQELVNNGSFDVVGFELKNDSFQTPEYGDVVCPLGYILDITMCKPCPIGFFLNDTVCDKCAIGQYKADESEIVCNTCPTGYSTRQTGSKTPDDCIELCSPGTYSPDTMESCSACLRGTYQDGQGQTSCKQCPDGTTTESTNCTSVSECASYDVLLETTDGDVTVAQMSESLDDISFMFWSKRVDGQSSNTVVRLTNDGGSNLIVIYLTEKVRIVIPYVVDEIVGAHNSVAWSHVAVTWDTVNLIVTLYINGETVHTATAVDSPSSPLLQNGYFVVTSSGQSGAYLTGLHLLANVLTDTDIATHATSCHMTGDTDVINMEVFKEITEQGISLVIPSNCDALDECAVSSPCNGHPCINGQDQYTCTCLRGWSGSTCTVPPDFCVDNACTIDTMCRSGLSNYTCTCSPGYYGLLCEIPPVDGGLSEWSYWSTCSKSCDNGTQYRTRQCDSPVQDTYGNDCVGDLTEMTSCNTHECPVCEELQRKFGTLKNCTVDAATGSMTCTLYCEEDKEFPPGLGTSQVFTCGPDTDYKWDPINNTLDCVGPSGPRELEVTAVVDYTSHIPDSAEVSLSEVVTNNVNSTDCFNSANCQTSLDINASKRRRRSTETTLTVTFRIPLVLGPDLQYGVYVSSGTVSGALQELIDAMIFLESTAQYINNHASDVFDAVIDGVTYTADVSSLTFVGVVTCDSGQAASDGVCLECPSGTYLVDGVCSFCEKGTYQPSTGQTSCITCQSEMTTHAIGSSAVSQCSESAEVTSTGTTDTESTNDDSKDNDDDDDDDSITNIYNGSSDKKIVYIAIFMSIGAMVLAVVAIFIAVWFKKFRPQSKFTGSVTNMRSDTATRQPIVNRRAAVMTQLPRSLYQMTGPDISEYGEDGCMSDERSYSVAPHYVGMPSRNSTYLTPLGVDRYPNSPPPSYDPPAFLPGYTEKEENPYNSIYVSSNDSDPPKLKL